MPFCAKCGAILVEGASYCLKCGAAISGAADLGNVIMGALTVAGKEIGEAFKVAGQEIEKALKDARIDLSDQEGPFCLKCGKRNPHDAGFCFSCGARIPSMA
jgi:ribosomal protein L40E